MLIRAASWLWMGEIEFVRLVKCSRLLEKMVQTERSVLLSQGPVCSPRQLIVRETENMARAHCLFVSIYSDSDHFYGGMGCIFRILNWWWNGAFGFKLNFLLHFPSPFGWSTRMSILKWYIIADHHCAVLDVWYEPYDSGWSGVWNHANRLSPTTTTRSSHSQWTKKQYFRVSRNVEFSNCGCAHWFE